MIRLEQLSAADSAAIAQIAELESSVFPDPWSERAIADTAAQKCSFCVTASLDGRMTGYLLCYSVLDECEIARIAVKPEVRRQGIGKFLLEALEKMCRKNGISRILLDVRKSNETAVAFYKNNGFEIDGERRGYYGGNPPEDAILMGRTV